MSTVDLNTLTLKDLMRLQKDISKAVANYSDRQRADARAKVEAFAQELGFSLPDLVGIGRDKSARPPAAAKYRHPENPRLTWSGRGRRPLWFIAAIEGGKIPEELAI